MQLKEHEIFFYSEFVHLLNDLVRGGATVIPVGINGLASAGHVMHSPASNNV